MQPSEAALVLAKISSFDRRTVGEADACAWAEVLDGKVTLQDALAAVTAHFAKSTDWLMPAHVITLAKKIRYDRINSTPRPDLPDGLEQSDERRWLRVWRDQVASGETSVLAHYRADRDLGITRVPVAVADPQRVKQMLALMEPVGRIKREPDYEAS